MGARPLGPLFDAELSEGEALIVFRDRRASGTADEAQFLAMRAMAIRQEEANGHAVELRETVYAHLNRHPPNELMQKLVDDDHDDSVRDGERARLGNLGVAGTRGLVLVFGGLLTALQIVSLIRG